jgi:hypothetical protein
LQDALVAKRSLQGAAQQDGLLQIDSLQDHRCKTASGRPCAAPFVARLRLPPNDPKEMIQ